MDYNTGKSLLTLAVLLLCSSCATKAKNGVDSYFLKDGKSLVFVVENHGAQALTVTGMTSSVNFTDMQYYDPETEVLGEGKEKVYSLRPSMTQMVSEKGITIPAKGKYVFKIPNYRPVKPNQSLRVSLSLQPSDLNISGSYREAGPDYNKKH